MEFVKKFVSRKAFIYMMEILAAVVAVVFMQDELPPYFITFVDNQAGKSALQKGYGNDPPVNAIITHSGPWFRREDGFPSSSTCRQH